ncbi:AAA family ATPase [Mariniblastus sp.]|nr:AAA family ATPase [Mariniblastus sp.]
MNIVRDNIIKAREYAALGLQVIPLHHPNGIGCSCGRLGCKAIGKHPRLKQWQDKATDDVKTIEAWFEQWPEANVGIRLGPYSGIVDVEFDDDQGRATAARLLNGIETPTFESQRSTHRLFRFPENIEIPKAVEHVEGLEIRFGTDSKGAQSVFPPSMHNSGKRYAWADGLSQSDCDFAPFPQSLVELLQPKCRYIEGVVQPEANGELAFTMSSSDMLDTHPGGSSGTRHKKLCELIGRELAINGATAELPIKALAWAKRCCPPMDEGEAVEILSRLINKHVSKPAEANDKPEKSLRGSLSVTPFDEIEPQEVKWLWQNRIPRGKLTLLVGEPGLGKTFAAIDTASRVSTGSAFPDETPCEMGEVLILTCEDGPGDTLRPRLDKHEADVSKIGNINGIKLPNGETLYPSLRDHLPTLERYFEDHPELKLLVIDPISGFLGDKTDSHNNTSVRAVLGPVCELAEKYQVAILGITHLAKSEAKAINRVIGSIAFVAAARAAWLVAKDDDDDERRLFLPIKNNLAQSQGLAYRIIEGRCEWESDPVLIAADDVGGENETPRDEAKAWLKDMLAQPMAAKMIFRQAKADGISEKTLKRAKKELKVISEKLGKAWVWRFADQPVPELSEDKFIVS